MINVVLSVVVLVSVLVLVVNPGAFGKIWRSIRAKFGSWGDAVERANSVENLQQAIKDERSNIGEGKKSLFSVEETLLELRRLIAEDEDNVKKLSNRIQLALSRDDKAAAEKFALQLGDCEKSLALNKDLLVQNEAAYNELSNTVKATTDTLELAEERAKRLKTSLEVKEKSAKLMGTVTNFSDNTGRLKELEKVVEGEINRHQAVINVEKSLVDTTEDVYNELERETKAEEILKRFSK